MACLFIFLMVSFREQYFNFDKAQFSISVFVDCAFGVKFKDFLLGCYFVKVLVFAFYIDICD